MTNIAELLIHTSRWFLAETEPSPEILARQVEKQNEWLNLTKQSIEEFWHTPSPPEHVRRALRLANLKKSDIILDVGAGDGRLALMALQEFHVKRAYAVEANPTIVQRTQPLFKGIPQLVYTEGLFQTVELAKDVTFAFLLAWHCQIQTIEELAKRLRKETLCRVLIHNSGKPFEFKIEKLQ